VFVGNLNPETEDQELRLNFDRFGKIVSIDRRTDEDCMLFE
jgi:RNA recognition motif-containing protein